MAQVYTTLQGDRWDLIAYKFFGDPWDFESIIAANPTIPAQAILPTGTKLTIPDLITVSESRPGDTLPWWQG